MSSLLLVGHGNMGSAMLASWQKNPAHGISNFYVAEKNDSTLPANVKPDVVVFAVKPQQLAEILSEYKNKFGNAPLYISVAAGKTLQFFSERMGAGAKVVRCMPNTPALVGKAVTALCANANVKEKEKISASALMASFGKAIWVEEQDMDAVTAISGSGPAYVFLFLEALTKAGVKSGLSVDTAKTLALEMMHGSLHLAAKSEDGFEKLRENVTSKGGTTEAALEVLMREDALEKLIGEAVQVAVKRAKDLS